MAPKDSQYAPLYQYDVNERQPFYSDPPSNTDVSLSPLAAQLEGRSRRVTNGCYRWEWVTRGALFLLSVVFFIFWISSANMDKCTYVAKYSPANEAIEHIEHVKYKGSLHFTTPWRGNESGTPSPDIDAAWRRISTEVKPIQVTETQLNKMGMVATSTTVKIPQEEGGGYLASLEVTHHLHCLDMLRKATYREHYESFDHTFQIEDATLMNQLDTCVEILRQALMCFPDVNMVQFYWVHGYQVPFADSNTVHRCKNFEKILDCAAWKAVDVPCTSSARMEKPEDAATVDEQGCATCSIGGDGCHIELIGRRQCDIVLTL